MWCTVWKGTAQDCIDYMRRVHKVPPSVKVANLARYFPPWTVTREQWADMMMPSISAVAIDTLLYSRIGSPLCHRYRIIARTGHILTSVACFPRGIRLRGGAPAPSPACSGASRTDCAAYGQSGECAILICSRSPDCFPGATTSSTERG